MTQEETYNFIGKLAVVLYSQGIRISFDSLKSILADQGKKYGSNRAVARGVDAAYKYWARKGNENEATATAIAYTYTGKDGTLAWSKTSDEEPEELQLF